MANKKRSTSGVTVREPELEPESEARRWWQWLRRSTLPPSLASPGDEAQDKVLDSILAIKSPLLELRDEARKQNEKVVVELEACKHALARLHTIASGGD
jgi:hypothetical protein